jgi:hypothetical protein
MYSRITYCLDSRANFVRLRRIAAPSGSCFFGIPGTVRVCRPAGKAPLPLPQALLDPRALLSRSLSRSVEDAVRASSSFEYNANSARFL